ncbi:MAG TPA: LytTR family DNA-binding domain-containing protein, partial [Roseivirga sp.]
YITSDGAYCEFFIEAKERPEIDRQSLTALEETLPINFVRIHRSTIVNMDVVKQIRASSVTLNSGEKLVISRTYKERVKEVMRNKEG